MSGIRKSIKDLAEYTVSLAKETEETLNRLTKEINAQSSILAAIVKVVGEDKIKEAVELLKREQYEKEWVEKEKARQALVEKGVLSAIETVTEDCLIVGTDTYPNGDKRIIQTESKRLSPDALARFLGKKVGDSIEANSVKFTITDIYTINHTKVDETLTKDVAEDKPAKQNPRVKKGSN